MRLYEPDTGAIAMDTNISEKVLQRWKDAGLADKNQDFNLIGSAMSTFLFYCKQCDCLHLGTCIRDKKRKVSSFFQFGNVEELERLSSEIIKAIAVLKDVSRPRRCNSGRALHHEEA